MIHISHSLLCLLARDICFKNEQIRRLRGRMISFFFTKSGRLDSKDVLIKKPTDHSIDGLYKEPGNFLLSHSLAAAVSSALEDLTSVFGMGTGVAPPARSPGIFFVNRDTKRIKQLFLPNPSRTKLHGIS